MTISYKYKLRVDDSWDLNSFLNIASSGSRLNLQSGGLHAQSKACAWQFSPVQDDELAYSESSCMCSGTRRDKARLIHLIQPDRKPPVSKFSMPSCRCHVPMHLTTKRPKEGRRKSSSELLLVIPLCAQFGPCDLALAKALPRDRGVFWSVCRV